jgi:hypothetical protein
MPETHEFRLGELLVARQAITQEQLDRALEIQRKTGQRLGEILVEQGLVTPEECRVALDDQDKLRAVAIAVLLTIGSTVFPMGSAVAAVQGNLAATSTASVTVSAIVPALVQISRFDDIVVPITSRDEDARAVEPVCVGGIGSSAYRVIANGSGPGGSFVLTSGGNEALPYTVSYRGDLSSGNTDTLKPGTPAGSYPILAQIPECGSRNTSAVEIGISANDIAKVAGGAYSGTLSLTVAAE